MIDWIKEHPYLAGSLALVLIILYFVYRSGKSSSAQSGTVYSGPSESLQAAQLQAGTQLQGYQLQSNLGIAQINAGVNVAQLGYAAQTTQAGLAAQVQLENILAAQNVTNTQTAAQLQLGLAQVGQPAPVPVSLPSNNNIAPNSPVVTIYGQGQANQAAAAASSVVANNLPNPNTLAVPTSTQDYQAYISSLNLPPFGSVDPATVAARQAVINQANMNWVSDPCSPHNVDYSDPQSVPARCGGNSFTVPPANPPTSTVNGGLSQYGPFPTPGPVNYQSGLTLQNPLNLPGYVPPNQVWNIQPPAIIPQY